MPKPSRRMVMVKNKGHETRLQMQWVEVRLAEVYMDLRDTEKCRLWLETAQSNPAYDEKAIEKTNEIEKWLIDQEKNEAEDVS